MREGGGSDQVSRTASHNLEKKNKTGRERQERRRGGTGGEGGELPNPIVPS